MRLSQMKLLVAAGFLILLAACGDSESAKKRLLETGKKYFDNGKFTEASIIYRKAIQKDPRYGEAYYRLGLVELRRGNYGEALRSFRRASELQLENDDAHSKLGDLYLAIYLSDRVKHKALLSDFQELADRILKRNPKSFVGLRMKGYIAAAAPNIKEALGHFQAAHDMQPADASVTLALAQALAADGQIAEAEKLATSFLEKDKTYGRLYDFLYFNKLREKNITAAEAILKSKIENNPKNAPYVLELATHYLRNNQPDQTRAVMDRMVANKADFPHGRAAAGDFYYRVGRFDDAIKQYEAGAAANTSEKAAFQKKLVEVLSAQGRRQEAIQLTDQVLSDNKDDAEALALRASLRLQAGKVEDLETSIAELQSVLAKMPNNPVVRFNLGEALLMKGNRDQARSQLLEAIKISPNYFPAKLALGRTYMASREPAKALQYADEIIKVNPNLLGARILRASALMTLKDFKTVRPELELMVEKIPNFKDARFLLANLDLAENRVAQAESGFRALFNTNPPDLRGLFGLAEVYLATNRPDLASQILDTELKKSPNNQEIRMAFGNTLVRIKRYEPAIEQFKQLIQSNAKSADLHNRLAATYRMAGKPEEAYQYFDLARQLAPKDVTPLINMVGILEQQGKPNQAKPLYQKMLEVSPDHPVALNNLAYRMAEEGGDLDQALTYAQKAKQKMPTNLDISDTLGWIYIKKNLSDDAIKIFRDLLTRNPAHVTWRYHLAVALFQKGDKLAAKKELQTALGNKPSQTENRQIQDLLGRIG
ncbi:MAG: tetratricopeptide repeat protein [Acidobacteriia bacterium]|nr:tetratricopeptide repeat protein [Terriglobia bacterium]